MTGSPSSHWQNGAHEPLHRERFGSENSQPGSLSCWRTRKKDVENYVPGALAKSRASIKTAAGVEARFCQLINPHQCELE
jgi:glycogen debranching enzyme